MSFQSDMAATAHELLTEFGTTATLVKVVVGTYDTSTGSVSNTETSYTITMYEEDASGSDVDGSQIKAGDKLAMISTDGSVQPETNDRITYQSADWMVVDATRENVNGLACVYYVTMRK
jgi:hypothetical protein